MKITWENDELDVNSLGLSASEFSCIGLGFPKDLNGYSLQGHSEIIRKVLLKLDKPKITEVGVFKGRFTQVLIELQRDGIVGDLDLIDTVFLNSTKAMLEEASKNGAKLTCHEKTSIEALENIQHMDVCFLDGDHNFETVSTELIICQERQVPIVFLDDTSWPCSRWDTAYDLANLKDQSKFESGGLTPFSDKVEKHYSLQFEHSRYEYGKTGVLTALESFLDKHRNYRVVSLAGYYGLSILWDPSLVTVGVNNLIRRLGEDFDKVDYFIRSLELNRIMLLLHLENSGRIWREQKSYIEILEKKLLLLEQKL
jgi:hypothetical protein